MTTSFGDKTQSLRELMIGQSMGNRLVTISVSRMEVYEKENQGYRKRKYIPFLRDIGGSSVVSVFINVSIEDGVWSRNNFGEYLSQAEGSFPSVECCGISHPHETPGVEVRPQPRAPMNTEVKLHISSMNPNELLTVIEKFLDFIEFTFENDPMDALKNDGK